MAGLRRLRRCCFPRSPAAEKRETVPPLLVHVSVDNDHLPAQTGLDGRRNIANELRENMVRQIGACGENCTNREESLKTDSLHGSERGVAFREVVDETLGKLLE